MNLLRIKCLFLSILMTCLSPSLSWAAELPWEDLGNDDGVQVFRQDIPGSPVVAFMGEGYIDAPLKRVASILLDCDKAGEWMPNLEECKVLQKIDEQNFVVYNHIGMPGLLSDREFVTRSRIVIAEDQSKISVIADSIPAAEVPQVKHVLGEIHGKWILESREEGKRTWVRTEIHADPKGSIPKWIVNFFQKKNPVMMFGLLRERVADSKVVATPRIQEVLERLLKKPEAPKSQI